VRSDLVVVFLVRRENVAEDDARQRRRRDRASAIAIYRLRRYFSPRRTLSRLQQTTLHPGYSSSISPGQKATIDCEVVANDE
jgi:hypothetical protein